MWEKKISHTKQKQLKTILYKERPGESVKNNTYGHMHIYIHMYCRLAM